MSAGFGRHGAGRKNRRQGSSLPNPARCNHKSVLAGWRCLSPERGGFVGWIVSIVFDGCADSIVAAFIDFPR